MPAGKRVRLREVREARLMTQKELADAAGVAESTVVRLETGQTLATFRTIRKLAKALGVEPSELLVKE